MGPESRPIIAKNDNHFSLLEVIYNEPENILPPVHPKRSLCIRVTAYNSNAGNAT